MEDSCTDSGAMTERLRYLINDPILQENETCKTRKQRRDQQVKTNRVEREQKSIHNNTILETGIDSKGVIVDRMN
uniref:Uncharacterized protein n=1 Tax=Pristionchus pacificus TaxID=54126 RepID=A0A2A6B514_PRIPA|eukprot:PDM60962.1 hypothetical protein PRIPAC_54768 [Pristionchus pacificus]